jgi:hypothetical protein
MQAVLLAIKAKAMKRIPAMVATNTRSITFYQNIEKRVFPILIIVYPATEAAMNMILNLEKAGIIDLKANQKKEKGSTTTMMMIDFIVNPELF